MYTYERILSCRFVLHVHVTNCLPLFRSVFDQPVVWSFELRPCVVAYGPVRQAGKFDLMWLRRTFSVRANISAFKKGEHECRHLSHHTNYHTDSCTERMSSPCAFTQQIREVPWYASGCVPRVRTLQHAIQHVCAPGCVMRARVCVCVRAERSVACNHTSSTSTGTGLARPIPVGG